MTDLYTWASENNPSLIKEYSANNPIDIHHISKASNNKVEWVCSLCGHKWEDYCYNRTAHGRSCPLCTLRKSKRSSIFVSGVNDLFTWASANNPNLIKEYSPNNPKDIHNIARSSDTKVDWVCSVCGNTWTAKVSSRTAGGTGCPICAALRKGQGDKQVDNDLFTWASENNPSLIKEYSSNNPIDIHNISRASSKKVEWVCSSCGHTWEALVLSRTVNGSGCPKCSLAKKIRRGRQGKNDLFTWASENNPILIKEYSPNNPVGIHNIARASNTKVEWVCSSCGHTWKALVLSRTVNGSGCPRCNKRGRRPKHHS